MELVAKLGPAVATGDWATAAGVLDTAARCRVARGRRDGARRACSQTMRLRVRGSATATAAPSAAPPHATHRSRRRIAPGTLSASRPARLRPHSSVFERFRGPDTDETRTVLLKSVAEFAQPLTDAFKAVHARVGAGTAAGEGPAALGPPLGVLRAAVVVYGLLTVIDLPEYFEDALAEWMGYFHTSLTCVARAERGGCTRRLAAADHPPPPPPTAGTRTRASRSRTTRRRRGRWRRSRRPCWCDGQGADGRGLPPPHVRWRHTTLACARLLRVQDVVALFASKYDADFEPFFSTFVSDVWSLLSAASATR